MNATAKHVLRSALVGGAVCGVAQAASIAWIALARASDAATTRMAETITRSPGDARWLFVTSIVVAVVFFGALIGAGHGALRVWARGPKVTSLWVELAWTLAVLGTWILGRFCASPALMAAALPDWGWLAWCALHASPWIFHGLMVGGVVAAGFHGLRRRRFVVSRRGLFLAGAAGLACLVGMSSHAARRWMGPAPDGSKTNVLILAADSVRPDHMTALGYGRPTTPNLDRLAAAGVFFDRAMAPLARTTPSWVSILTGRYPHGHGIRHMFPERSLRPRSLATLPRAFAEAGYRTAVVADYAGDFFPTFDFGFEHERLPPPLTLRTVFETQVLMRSLLAIAFLAPLPEMLRPRAFRYLMSNADPERLADEVIEELSGRKPFFTVAFFSATHVPFASPYPHWRDFVARDYRGEHRYQYDVVGLSGLTKAEASIAPADVAQVVALYDGALRATDQAIGRILGELERRGLSQSTLVVFLADHGENLFEPGQTTLHGKWFRGGDEANRAPLIVRGPGVHPGVRVTQSVSLVDLSPTLGEWLRIRVPPSEGRSLASALRGERLAPMPVFAETGIWLNGGVSPDGLRYPDLVQLLDADERRDDGQIVLSTRYEDDVVTAKHRAIWSDPWKLIYEPTRTGARIELYDRIQDPGQTRNLSDVEPEVVKQMFQALRSWMNQDRERRLDGRGHVTRIGG